MRLFEAILNANHRAIAGDTRAGVRPAEHAQELPLIALSCIDPRLNPLLPEVLGIPEADFIWLRNAGNIITGPLSSTMRSLALACAIKKGRQIAVIGHSDCQVYRNSAGDLVDHFAAVGVPRSNLPSNLTEFFGLASNERQGVVSAVNIIRASPLISRNIAVHGLLVDIETGRLDWLVNGYQPVEFLPPGPISIGLGLEAFKPLGDFGSAESKPLDSDVTSSAPLPPSPPLPPPIPPAIPPGSVFRPKLSLRRGHK